MHNPGINSSIFWLLLLCISCNGCVIKNQKENDSPRLPQQPKTEANKVLQETTPTTNTPVSTKKTLAKTEAKPKKVSQDQIVKRFFGERTFDLFEVNMLLDNLIKKGLLTYSNRTKLYNSLRKFWVSGGGMGLSADVLYRWCIRMYGEKVITGYEFCDIVMNTFH